MPVPKRLPLCAGLRVEQGIHIALGEGRRNPAVTVEQAIGDGVKRVIEREYPIIKKLRRIGAAIS